MSHVSCLLSARHTAAEGTCLVNLVICRFFQKPSFRLTQLNENFCAYCGRFCHDIPQDLEIIVRTAIDTEERP